MHDTAFILESQLDRQALTNMEDVTIRPVQRSNRFGAVHAVEMTIAESKCLIYEEGGMNGIRTLPDCQMPVFTDMFLHGIKNVYLLGYCGSLEKSTAIGTLVIPHDFLDCTRNRRRSFIEAIAPGTLFFYRMSNPYSPGLQRLLLRAAETQGLRCQDIDIYAVTEGPRFETRAEVQALATLGAQAVCFSGVPDASFARELNMNFACAFFVSNYGEGMPGGAFETILHTAAEQSTAISRLVVTLVRRDVATAIDPGFHDQYWMQRPPQEVFDDIY